MGSRHSVLHRVPHRVCQHAGVFIYPLGNGGHDAPARVHEHGIGQGQRGQRLGQGCRHRVLQVGVLPVSIPGCLGKAPACGCGPHLSVRDDLVHGLHHSVHVQAQGGDEGFHVRQDGGGVLAYLGLGCGKGFLGCHPAFRGGLDGGGELLHGEGLGLEGAGLAVHRGSGLRYGIRRIRCAFFRLGCHIGNPRHLVHSIGGFVSKPGDFLPGLLCGITLSRKRGTHSSGNLFESLPLSDQTIVHIHVIKSRCGKLFVLLQGKTKAIGNFHMSSLGFHSCFLGCLCVFFAFLNEFTDGGFFSLDSQLIICAELVKLEHPRLEHLWQSRQGFGVLGNFRG